MMHQKFILKSSAIAGIAPTCKGENPDVNYASMGLKAVRVDIAEGKVPVVSLGLDVKTVDVDLANCNVVLNAVPTSVPAALELLQGLQNALVQLGILVPDEPQKPDGEQEQKKEGEGEGTGIILAK